MSVDVSQQANLIRQAIHGKDVREALASGIETISNDVNSFEVNIGQQEDKFENNITKKENDFETAITKQQNDYETDLNKNQSDYETKVNKDWYDYKTVMDADEAAIQNNENTRKDNETVRLANEDTRQTIYNEFRDFVNTSTHVNRVPYLFDGGSFGDSGDQGTWTLSMDGGSF